MKIQIDTNKKTIKVEENLKFSELISGLKKLFPNGEWKEYTLESNSIIYWNNYPIITYNGNTNPWWQQPYYTNGVSISTTGLETPNTFTYGSTDGSMLVNQKVGNINHADGEENQEIPKGIFNVQL